MFPAPWNGSVTIYNKVIRPFVLKHQTKIDQTLDKAADVAQNVYNEGKAKCFSKFILIIKKIIS